MMSDSTTAPTASMTQNTVDNTIDSQNNPCDDISSMPPNKYFAGLIDAQLSVSTTKNNTARATLTSQDPRIAEQISIKFRPTRITIIKRPAKPDQCTILFTGDNMMSLLQFAVQHCVMKRDLAQKTLEYVEEKASATDLANTTMNPDLSLIDLDWAGGYFDVRGSVTQDIPATKDAKKKRGSVKLVFPKHERYAIPALQRVVQGRIKKNSPCRLVYDTKDSIRGFLETMNEHVWAKKSDLDQLTV